MPPFASAIQMFLDEFDKGSLFDFFMEHFRYGTADCLFDGERVNACIRWNLSKTGKVATVLDLFIRDEVDGKKVIREFTRRGLKRFPSIKYIKFTREFKYPGRKPVVYKIGE